MFEYPPIWLNVCIEFDTIRNNLYGWGYDYASGTIGHYYGNLICYATTSYSDNWGVGDVSYPYNGNNIYPFGKRINNEYYWYSTISAKNQYNYKDYIYYWICLEYNQ